MKSGGTLNLSYYRKQKGLTQEELAEQSGITSRTIQRIENGQVVPQAYTLKILAQCLDVKPEDLYTIPEDKLSDSDETNTPSTGILAAMHIVPLIGIYMPLTNVLISLLFWLFKKDEHPAYHAQGRQIINFQITLSIVNLLAIVLMVLFFPVGYPLLMLYYIFAVVMAVYNMSRVLKHHPAHYPLSLRIIKSGKE